MNSQERLLLNELNRWEHAAWESEHDFLEKFCRGGTDLIEVSWSAAAMRVNYLVDEGQTVTDSIVIREWLDWYEKHSEGEEN